ncbi:hypothetical protein A6U87_14690 [Rhizobium sp. AC44/96]|uniref:hypothetical protein n=1 Tax=Rhizobium sp. AC44/96 TaxID=1841654 RepID=UPI00080FD3C8|nr:hypothetical protein [Rhizobium sp. AC44/96]OCJ05253.1 hypothetical protein A6U87_14690 [Rhizobium sp. AC44/96]
MSTKKWRSGKYFFQGKKRTVTEIAEITGVRYDTIRERLKRGQSLKQAATPTSPPPIYTHDGKTLNLTDWANATGIPRARLYARIVLNGWPIEMALTTPYLKGHRGIGPRAVARPPKPHPNAKRYEFAGKSLTIPEWSRELGIAKSVLRDRIEASFWPVERALTEPLNRAPHQRKVTRLRLPISKQDRGETSNTSKEQSA